MNTLNVCVGGVSREVPVVIDICGDPADHRPLGVLLGHGATGDLSSANLPLYAAALARAGVPCLRFTCSGTSVPRRVAVAKALLQHFKSADSTLRFPVIDHWIIAGHSMGARVAAQLAADLPDIIAAVVLLSYPLHPPREPSKLRDTPLTSLQLPMLLVRGRKDVFSQAPVWDTVIARIASEHVVHHTVPGGNHLLKVRGGFEARTNALEDVCNALVNFCQSRIVKKHAGGLSGALPLQEDDSHEPTKKRKSRL